MSAFRFRLSCINDVTALKPVTFNRVLGQYREMGVALWRGCTPAEHMAQSFSTEHDTAKGRQMPVVCILPTVLSGFRRVSLSPYSCESIMVHGSTNSTPFQAR